MQLEIKIPSPGESITEVELSTWFVEDGSLVSRNQEIGEVESEKATLPLIAEQAGKLEILVPAGETVSVGKVVARIDTEVKLPQKETREEKQEEEKEGKGEKKEEKGKEPDRPTAENPSPAQRPKPKLTPLSRKILEAEGLELEDVLGGHKKADTGNVGAASRTEERNKLSQLRKKISERLVAVKNETAMLTTFNEADLSTLIATRAQLQEDFQTRHQIKLGYMSFFTKAVCLALAEYPAVNARIEGDELIVPTYCDIGIAVQTEKGLMVPVLRNAESMGLAQIEMAIADLAAKARKARLGIAEMSGGSFTISNGGIYGSMLSTPILNPPQSGILGMHNIIERPIAVNGKIEIRPMMYLALSYDHRVIDGKDSVGFLKMVKELIEAPARLLTDPA
ncbi:MAG: dihydrolipoyllysine-residue succinyltransferase [Bacteroidetes bacterium]|nr:MAG: dihydrolipoyllysine-residue succinyltransferase [Bacteroidota bacterium]